MTDYMKMAKRIGLEDAWPVIRGTRGIDARAYAVAQRVWEKSPIRQAEIEKALKADNLTIWDEKRIRQIWGCLKSNIKPDDIPKFWRAAGCKNNRKFRAQVMYKTLATRSQTANQFIHYAEGMRWLNEAYQGGLIVHSCRARRNAAAAFGKLKPEFRWAAMMDVYEKKGSIHEWPVIGRVRIIDLNWEAVRLASEAKKAGNMRVYAALAYPPVVMKELCLSSEEELVAFICPAYPKLPYEMARKIALGTSPVELSGNQLTKKEAHQWLLDGAPGAPECKEWFAKKNGLPYHRSIRVMRWMLGYRQSGRWDVLERKREMRVEGEPPKVCSILDILDEIQEEDIQTMRDSVRRVMSRVAERKSQAWQMRYAEDHTPLAPVPSWAAFLPKEIRLLNTAAELIAEGNEMRHCVGSYINAVRHGKCHILSLSTDDGRSTVELSPTLDVIQHFGAENSLPPKRNKAVLQAFLDLVKKT